MKFIWAVATWHEERIYRVSPFFYHKSCAESEYNQLGNSLNLFVLQGRVFLYRHAVHDDDDDDSVSCEVVEPEEEHDVGEPDEEPSP